MAEILQVEPGSLRSFKDRATDAAIMFNDKFHYITPPLRTRNKKGILAAFAAEHRHFLDRSRPVHSDVTGIPGGD